MEEPLEAQLGHPNSADTDGSEDSVSRTIEAQLQHEDAKHIAGPPNERFTTALIAGLVVHDSAALVDPLNPPQASQESGHLVTSLFSTQFEQVSLWLPSGEDDRYLVTSVSPDVKSEDWWKTVASCLRFALALDSRAEAMRDLELYWLQDFDPAKAIDDHVLHGVDHSPPYLLEGGLGLALSDMVRMLPIVDALLRDDRFYAAAQHLVSAIQNHPACMYCLLGGPFPPKDHHEEPELWQVADWVPGMEVAIVQATKACEALLGQPGKRVEAARERWVSAVDLDPDKPLGQTGKTHFDFYCALFSDHRDGAAHGNEGFRYHVRRRDCLHTLVLAWRVVHGRYLRIAAPFEEVAERLRVNPALLAPGME